MEQKQTKAMTGAERIAAFRARKAQENLVEVRGVYIHPSQVDRLRKFASKLQKPAKA